MHNIQRLSKILIVIFYVVLIILPIFPMINWLFNETYVMQFLMKEGVIREIINTQEGPINLHEVKLTPLGRTLGILSCLTSQLTSWLGLIVLIKLFKCYQVGQIFTMTNVQAYRQLGWLCFINALPMRPLSELLSTLAVTLSNPPGQRYISIGFGSPNLYDIIVGLMIVTISWIMAEGYRLQNDQQLTV